MKGVYNTLGMGWVLTSGREGFWEEKFENREEILSKMYFIVLILHKGKKMYGDIYTHALNRISHVSISLHYRYN